MHESDPGQTSVPGLDFHHIYLFYKLLQQKMNHITRTIVGVLFLLLSVAAITLIRINPPRSTPTRSTQARTAGITKCLLPGLIITQELIAIKDYMSGIDLMFTHSGRANTNENTLLLLSENYKTLYKETFSSARVKEGDLTSFLFDKSIFVGKGNRVHICLYSNDGNQNNTVSSVPSHMSSRNFVDLLIPK